MDYSIFAYFFMNVHKLVKTSTCLSHNERKHSLREKKFNRFEMDELPLIFKIIKYVESKLKSVQLIKSNLNKY